MAYMERIMSEERPRRVITQPYDFSVQDLVNKIENKDIDLTPAYQRNDVWGGDEDNENKRSRLIESLLLNIPIPVIYFAEQEEVLTYDVIDGQQRLRTFDDFLNDRFALRDLDVRSDVNGKKYSQLELRDKNEIRKRSIRAIVILNDSDEEIKYEVFERLNLGSILLTPQEIRNNAFRGSFNNLLKELSNDSDFEPMIKFRLSSDKKNMAREELVLRFFAYHENELKPVKNLSYFLTKHMKKNQNIDQDKVFELKNLFIQTIKKIKKYLGKDAFCIFKEGTNKFNTTLNRSLFDAEMLAFALVPIDEIKVTPDEFLSKLKLLMTSDKAFQKNLEKARGSRIKERVDAVKLLLVSEE